MVVILGAAVDHLGPEDTDQGLQKTEIGRRGGPCGGQGPGTTVKEAGLARLHTGRRSASHGMSPNKTTRPGRFPRGQHGTLDRAHVTDEGLPGQG